MLLLLLWWRLVLVLVMMLVMVWRDLLSIRIRSRRIAGWRHTALHPLLLLLLLLLLLQ